METRDLLLEVGTEEIPARMLDNGVADLARLVGESLAQAGLAPSSVTTFATPRRLAVRATGVPVSQADREDLALGPSVSAAFGPDGAPTKAAEGFARGQGVDAASLLRVQGPKGEVVAVRKAVKGRPTADVLAEVLPTLLPRLAFPKSMRWSTGIGPFVRPVHWIVALFGADVVPFAYAGIASGRATCGHRFLSPDPVDLPDPSAYEATLRARGVEPVCAIRKAAVVAAMADAEATHGGRFIRNEALVHEVSNLIESPVFAVAGYDADFLQLPAEVLVTAMGAHQRFFAMEDTQGRLLPRFGVVSNTRATDMSVVSRGNERVLAARLYDARFFWKHDLAEGLPVMAARLPQRLFLKGAGDMAEKTARVQALAGALCDAAGATADDRAQAVRAAALCKADLMSTLVGEFPELQGVMGMYFAKAGNEPVAVATAIREHYLPRFAGDALPATVPGAVLAVADRLDSITACYAVGAIPTGSKDPLALRRAAIGILRLCAETPVLQRLPLSALLDLVPCLAPAVRTQVEAFFADRFRGILADEHGVPTDVATAVTERLSSDASPAELVARAKALAAHVAATSGFGDFLDNVYKRVGNLLRKADEDAPGWREAARAAHALDDAADHGASLALPQELEVEGLRVEARTALQAARASHDAAAVLDVMFRFRDPLARFFGTGRDGVPVLIEADEGLRLRRLALLLRVQSLFDWFAEFGRISTR